MDIIDSQTVVVYNHSDLNTALSIDNGYIYVHLGDSFAITGGININANKPSLLISGIDPRDPAQDIHTLTDHDSASSSGGIYLSSVCSMQIELRNLNMVGRNYYGMPCIWDYSGNEAVVVSYYNVVYTGPQVTWHPRGLIRYVDCNITISQGYSPAQEVCEVSRVELGGSTVIEHNSTTHPVFQLYNRGGPSITILEDADITVTTVNDFVATEAYFPFLMGARSRLTLTTQDGICRGSGDRITNFTMSEDSEFNYTRLSNSGNANSLFINGTLTLERGADLLMIANFSGSTGALIYFISSSAQLRLNNPKRFALYNSGTSASSRPMYFGYTTNFSFTCNQVNYWRSAMAFPAAGTFTDKPPWQWHRTEWGDFELGGTFANSAISILSTSLTAEELAELPPFSELLFSQSKVFAVGSLPLEVDGIVADMRPITGHSLPDIDILVSYIMGPFDRSRTAFSEDDGYFAVEMDEPAPLDTDITVSANWRFILSAVVQRAEEPGELGIYEAPLNITFTINPISLNPVILPRTIPSAPVIISDERASVDKTDWVLWAKIDGPLRTASGLTLPDAVVFVRNWETEPVTLSNEFILVHVGIPFIEEQEEIIWDNDKGVLARITAPIRVNETYTASLTWMVLPEGEPPEGT